MSDKNNQFSETDTAHKIIVPYLENLGFKKSEMEFEFPIKAQIGSGKAKTVFADIVIRQKGKAVVIIEIKKPDHRLEERDREQAISYARLFDPEPINFAVVTNGRIWQAYNVKTKERIPKVPSKDTLFKDMAKFKLTDDQREEANYFAVEGYETVQDIENALRKCHDTLYANDGLTPLQTFEEINKFLFSKIQEERRVKKHSDQNRFTTKYLKTRKPKVEMQRIFEDAINDFPNDIEKIFFKGDEIEVCDESILQVVKVLENKGFTETDIDIVGMAYETFLKPVFRNKHLGQYFTPREIVNFMIGFLKPEIGNLVIDPAFGSGGFLVEVFQILKEKIAGSDLQKEIREDYNKKLCSEWIFGTEIAPHLAKACKINMYIHGDGKTGVYKHDGLVDYGRIEENKFNLVLTNPSFGGVINKEDLLENFELGKGRARQLKEVLFLERCIRLAKSGGKIGIILPDGILTNSSLQYVRDFIMQECKILGVVSLPNHAFSASGAGVKASIMFLEKKEEGKDYSNYDIFMAEAEHVGYDATGRPDDNEFGDILDKYYEFKVKNGGADEKIFFLKNDKLEGRLDPKYYKSCYKNIKLLIDSSKYKTEKLGELLIELYRYPTFYNIEFKKNGVPVLKISNINKKGLFNSIDDNKIKYDFIDDKTNKKFPKTVLKENDLVIAVRGATIGKTALIEKKFEGSNINANLIRVSLDKSRILPLYFWIYLRSKVGQGLFLRNVSNTAKETITVPHIKNIDIVLPPYDIQEKIVYEFKKYQQNITSYENVIQELKKKSEKFLEESLGFKTTEDKNKQSFELNVQNLSGARFDPNYYQGEYRSAEETLKNSKYPLQKIGDVLKLNSILEDMKDYEEINYIDLSCVDNEFGEILKIKNLKKNKIPSRARQKLEKGDFLVASLKGSLGSIAVFKQDTDNVIASTGFLLIKNSVNYNAIFLKALFQNSIIQKVIERRMTGSIMAAISQKEFKNIQIPFPPLDEQNRISKQIKKYESEIDNLRNKIKQEKEKQDKVLNVLF